MNAWLVVRSAEWQLALPVATVEELVTLPPPLPAPGVLPAVRGVAPHRGRLVPLVHLAAALGGGTPPQDRGTTGVAVALRGRTVLLEVEEADLIESRAEPLPLGWRGQWAAGALRPAGSLVPIVDLDWLGDRLMTREPSATP